MKGFLINLASSVAVWSGFNAVYGSTLKDRAFVLMYHSISDGAEPFAKYYRHITLDSRKFERQIAFLKSHGHTFVRVRELEDALKRGLPKPTAIYFDDGFMDNLTIALPILRKFEAPATLFATTDFIDGKGMIWSIAYRAFLDHLGVPESDWPARVAALKSLSDEEAWRTINTEFKEKGFSPPKDFNSIFMDWNDLDELVRAGWEVGSHTVSHRRLIECSDADISHELLESKQRLETNIGSEVVSVSFPHGRVDGRVKEAVARAGYRAAVSVGQGLNSSQSLESERVGACGFYKNVSERVTDPLHVFEAKLYAGSLLKR